MDTFLPFVVIGIATGSVYGLAGIGLVLTYKTSGIFNFAYGSLAALTVFVFYWLHVQHGMAVAARGGAVPVRPGPDRGPRPRATCARILEPVGATLKVVATVGLLLIVLGIGTIWYGDNAVNFPRSCRPTTVQILGRQRRLGPDHRRRSSRSSRPRVLYYFFRFVRLGIAMRGVVDNPDLVSITGREPRSPSAGGRGSSA